MLREPTIYCKCPIQGCASKKTLKMVLAASESCSIKFQAFTCLTCFKSYISDNVILNFKVLITATLLQKTNQGQ